MLKTGKILEQIGNFWEMTDRQFSLLSEKETKYYENLQEQLSKYEGDMENDN